MATVGTCLLYVAWKAGLSISPVQEQISILFLKSAWFLRACSLSHKWILNILLDKLSILGNVFQDGTGSFNIIKDQQSSWQDIPFSTSRNSFRKPTPKTWVDLKFTSATLTHKTSPMDPELEGLPHGNYPKGGAGDEEGEVGTLTQDQLRK